MKASRADRGGRVRVNGIDVNNHPHLSGGNPDQNLPLDSRHARVSTEVMDYICAQCGAQFGAPDSVPGEADAAVDCPECGHSTASQEDHGERLEGPPVKLGEASGIDAPRPLTRPPEPSAPPSESQGPPAEFQGPSVIIDMGQLSETDSGGEDDSAEEEEFDERAHEAEIRATQEAFSPLSSTGMMPVLTDEDPELARSSPEKLPSEDPGEITEIKPPSMFRLVFLVLVLILASTTAFVSWRNDWNWSFVKDTPGEAIGIAFGFKEPAPVVQAPRPTVRRADQMRGDLEFVDLEVNLVPGQRGTKAAVITGKLRNGTNRIQKSISLELSLLSAGAAIKKRVLDCCEVIAPEEHATIAKNPDHPHFATDPPDKLVRLVPGESRPFTVIIPQIDAKHTGRPLTPKGAVRFSETERVAP